MALCAVLFSPTVATVQLWISPAIGVQRSSTANKGIWHCLDLMKRWLNVDDWQQAQRQKRIAVFHLCFCNPSFLSRFITACA